MNKEVLTLALAWKAKLILDGIEQGEERFLIVREIVPELKEFIAEFGGYDATMNFLKEQCKEYERRSGGSLEKYQTLKNFLMLFDVDNAERAIEKAVQHTRARLIHTEICELEGNFARGHKQKIFELLTKLEGSVFSNEDYDKDEIEAIKEKLSDVLIVPEDLDYITTHFEELAQA